MTAATPASVLAYLRSIEGKHCLSGQYIEMGPMTPINTVHNNTGEWLGLVGTNYWWAGSTAGSADLSSNALAKSYWNAGGLIMLSLFLPNPTTMGGLWDVSKLNADAIVRPGTTENTRYNQMIDSTITGLLDLQSAGVVVIFRPLFENNGGWFWWGIGLMSPQQFISAWRYMHARVTARGVKNILWLWAINAGPSTPPPNYPGDDVVDLVGQDLYSSNPAQGKTTYDMLVAAHPTKPMVLAEYGSGTPSDGDETFNQQRLIDALKTQMPKTVLWQQWWSAGNYNWGIEMMQNQKAISDPWVVNRGDFSVGDSVPPPPVTKRVVAPLTGTVTRGSWKAQDVAVPGVKLASNKAVHFEYLLPAQYDPAVIYPVLLWLHPNNEGSAWYTGGNGNPNYLSAYDADGLYNTVSFRTRYPCIVVVGYADQSGDSSGATQNWGGWVNNGQTGSGTVYSGDTGPNVFGILGVMAWVGSHLAADPSRYYVAGFSLGGHGAEYLMLKYNNLNGNPKVFAAGMSTGASPQIHGYGAGPSSADATAMRDIPVWWISGGNDTTSPAAHWNKPMWQLLAGNVNFPAPGGSAAQARAGTSQYRLWLDPAIGHQMTSAQGAPYPADTTILDFMFAQMGEGDVAVPPVQPPADFVVCKPGDGQSVKDAAGAVWSIDAAGNAIKDGAAVAGGGGTSALTSIDGVIWAQDGGGSGWYVWSGTGWDHQPGEPPWPSTPPTTPPANPDADQVVAQLEALVKAANVTAVKIQADVDAAVAAAEAAKTSADAARTGLRKSLNDGLSEIAAAIAKL